MDEYRNIVQACATQGQALAKRLAANGTPEPLYLYAKPSQPSKPGELRLVADSDLAPTGFDLVTPEGLRTSTPYESFFVWVYDRARSAPVMAIE